MPLLSLPSFLPFGLQPCHAFAVTLGLPSSWLATLQPLALVASPKLGLQHKRKAKISFFAFAFFYKSLL
jgi:hypothetical protein